MEFGRRSRLLRAPVVPHGGAGSACRSIRGRGPVEQDRPVDPGGCRPVDGPAGGSIQAAFGAPGQVTAQLNLASG